MAMKILFTGNCQVEGLEIFMRRALPHHEYRRLPHLATFYGEFSEEKIADDHAWADLVFFHHKHDHPQDYPTKQPKVPLSVWYQSGPFIACAEDWSEVEDRYRTHGMQEACRFAAEDADMGYCQRWHSCADRMLEKEEQEEVPVELQMSWKMRDGFRHQLQLTMNHPTSLVFREWTKRIVKFLGEAPALGGNGAVSAEEAIANPNLASLPCEQSATSAARIILGLSWGGRPEDDESGRLEARKRLEALHV